MPILPRQRDIHPPDLLEAGASEDAASLGLGRWVAFYTLSRREKDLMRKLEAVNVPFYAPLIQRRLHSPGGRTRLSHVPLFPGYVFSRVDDDQRRSALASFQFCCGVTASLNGFGQFALVFGGQQSNLADVVEIETN